MGIEYLENLEKLRDILGSEDAKGARRASKSRELGSLPSTPAIQSYTRGWVASHWNEYMRVSGWREQPCTKHETPQCSECYWFNENAGICCE